jgi:hypothetical protein
MFGTWGSALALTQRALEWKLRMNMGLFHQEMFCGVAGGRCSPVVEGRGIESLPGSGRCLLYLMACVTDWSGLRVERKTGWNNETSEEVGTGRYRCMDAFGKKAEFNRFMKRRMLLSLSLDMVV